MKNKMIYVMNVDWNWIKQRPHFFAEQFSNTYDITVFYQYLYNRKNLQTRENNKLKIKPLYLIPRIDRYASLKKINFFLKNLFIKRKIKKDKPEIVYFTFPDQYYSIPKNIRVLLFTIVWIIILLLLKINMLRKNSKIKN